MKASLPNYLRRFKVRIGTREAFITPEYFLTSFPPQIAYAKEDVARVVKESETPIFLGFAESAKDHYYSSYIGEIDGEMIHARKMRAYPKTERRYILDGVQRPDVWKTSLGKVTVLLCYDAYRVSKEPSNYFDHSIDVILVPSFWKLCHAVLLEKCSILSKRCKCNVINSDYYHGMHAFMKGDLTYNRVPKSAVFFKCVYCDNEAVDYCWNCCQELCLSHISYVNDEKRIGFCPLCQKIERGIRK